MNKQNQFNTFVKYTAILLFIIVNISCGGAKDDQNSNTPTTTTNNSIKPTITSPIYTNTGSHTISGTCVGSTSITLVGSSVSAVTCSSGSFSFTINQSATGTYNYTVKAENLFTHETASASLVWYVSGATPAAPILSSPASNPYHSNGNSITVSGSCETGATVYITGSATQSTSCASNSFSTSISKSSDATYSFSVYQTNLYGNTSTSSSFSWIRDTAAPSAPTITSPATNPYYSSDTAFNLSGACENGATVNLSGSQTDSVACTSSAYSFSITKSSDGTYNYSISQTDLAANTSTSTSFQWVRISTLPSTPVIATPAVSPYYSNGNSTTIAGSCTSGNTVNLSGASSSSTTCASSAFSFTVNNSSDGSYTYNVEQVDNASNTSAQASVVWVRDTVAPSTPTITSPASSPYYTNGSSITISGACESAATVNLSGSSSATTTCSASSYSFNVSKSSDGSYSFSVSQTDAAGNSSGSASVTWNRDTGVPSTPTITSHSSPYYSNVSSVVISGACESGTTVNLSGDSTSSTTCSSSAYSFNVSKSSDGSYSFSVSQTDLASNTSGSASFVWNRDATSPSAVTILAPATSPYTSADTTLSISGACESGATVNISGDSSSFTVCTLNSYTLSTTKGSDGTYNYTLNQTDLAGNVSSNTTFQWVRNTSIPATPVITTPSTSPYYSNGSSLTISGSCTTGNTVNLSGDATNTMTCASSAYSFSVSKSTDGTYNFSVVQINGSSISSAADSVQWIRDTVAPSVPTVTSPSSSPYYSNSNSITYSGACETNATVSISGSASSTTTCSASAYSFNVSKSSDATYNFSIYQTDAAGNVSGSISKTWVRDTVAPNAVTFTSPASNPYTSGDANITLIGNCEANATVTMSGSSSGSTTCSGLGQFSFNISKSVDGTYNFSIVQTDLAGNISANATFSWIRDTTVPSTPVITAPGSFPYYSNSNSITITATCDTSISPTPAEVDLSGDVVAGDVTSPAGSLAQNCTSSPVSFVIQKSSDGTYNFSVSQLNPNNSTTSASASVQWIRDTVAPSAPTITAPSSSPYTAPGNLTINGSCEANATVNLSGDSTQSTSCSSGLFSFTVVESVDATYNFTVKQTDLAGNVSSGSTIQWVRNSNSVPPPTITTPASSPYISNSSPLTISGACNSGYLVTLGGNVIASDVTSPSNSLTQTCSGSSYSFIIAKSSDSTYNFTLKQTFNSVDSSLASLSWTLDTQAPTATITAHPSNPNLVSTASFSFTSTESGTFQCKTDSGTYASCTSPVTLSSLTNASHTFYVKAIDLASNVSSIQSYTWTQSAYNAIALYHFDTTPGATVDSGSYTQSAGFSNGLVSSGSSSPTSATGKFNQASTLGSNVYYSVANNSSLQLGTSTMTVEGFVKFSSITTTTNNYYTLVSKSAASPNLGWELRLVKKSSKYGLQFVGSLDGTTSTTLTSSSSFSVSTGTWYYYAVTWNKGTVNFYFSSSSNTNRGSGTIGTVGSASLYPSTAALYVGGTPSSGSGASMWLTGTLDELRISQTVRTITFPTAAFNPD